MYTKVCKNICNKIGMEETCFKKTEGNYFSTSSGKNLSFCYEEVYEWLTRKGNKDGTITAELTNCLAHAGFSKFCTFFFVSYSVQVSKYSMKHQVKLR